MFKKTELEIPEVWLIEPKTFEDERGFFREIGRDDMFKDLGLPKFVQENHSRSVKNVVRGLHYQLNPKAQGKLVCCISGSIIDVAVDIRKGSPTYAKCIKIELNEYNRYMVFIPPGFLHGFVSYGKDAHVIYKTTEYYSPEHDRCINWDDPEIGIDLIIDGKIKISDKDKNAPLLKDADNNF